MTSIKSGADLFAVNAKHPNIMELGRVYEPFTLAYARRSQTCLLFVQMFYIDPS